MKNDIGIYNVRTHAETLQMLQDIHAIACFIDAATTIEQMEKTGLGVDCGQRTRESYFYQFDYDKAGNARRSISYGKPLSKDIMSISSVNDDERDIIHDGRSIIFFNRSPLDKLDNTLINARGQRGLISCYHFASARSGIGFVNMSYDSVDTDDNSTFEDNGFRTTPWIELNNPEESYFMNSTVQTPALQYISFLDFYLRAVGCPSIFVTYDAVSSVAGFIPLEYHRKAQNAMRNFHMQHAEMLVKLYDLIGE